jgi:hypothetical protein
MRSAIKGYLEGFIQGVVEQHTVGDTTKAVSKAKTNQRSKASYSKPFHEAILSEEVRRISTFERSFSTSLGSTFEQCAYLIAKQVHKRAERGFRGPNIPIPAAAVMKIEEIVAGNNIYGMSREFPELIREVLSAVSAETVSRPAIADLYFEKHDGSEWFFEIKSPQPNKGQCLEVTQRLLTVQAIHRFSGRQANTYYAMAYNPYGERSKYGWSFANRHLDMQNQVLLQEEFWTVVGDDPRTFAELLDIYREVGKEKSKYIIDKLAFGF